MRALLVLLSACGGGLGGGGGGGDDVIVEDRGRMCLHDQAGSFAAAQSFAAGQPVVIQVSLTRCLSSSCDVDRAMSCEVAVDGTSHRVASTASYTHDDTGGCTDDCGQLATTCTTAPLAAGDFTFRFGDQTLALTVPSATQEPPCIVIPE